MCGRRDRSTRPRASRARVNRHAVQHFVPGFRTPHTLLLPCREGDVGFERPRGDARVRIPKRRYRVVLAEGLKPGIA